MAVSVAGTTNNATGRGLKQPASSSRFWSLGIRAQVRAGWPSVEASARPPLCVFGPSHGCTRVCPAVQITSCCADGNPAGAEHPVGPCCTSVTPVGALSP